MSCRHDFPWLTLALHCCALNHVLMNIADSEQQMKMFPLTIEQRNNLGELAKTLELTKDNQGRVDRADWSLPFLKYEMFSFTQNHLKKDKNLELEPRIQDMYALSRGESLANYKPLIQFIYQMNGWALWEHENQRGGCF